MDLFLDYMQGKGKKWNRCNIKYIEKYRTKEDFFTTWQLYCNEHMGQYAEMYGNLVFDFDHETNIDYARKDCIKIYDIFVKDAKVKKENVCIYFSGSKGFHLEIDYKSFMSKPEYDLHLIFKEIYKHLENKIKPEKNRSTMDGSIYSSRRMWRQANTIHSKTGLYCRKISYDELCSGGETIKKLATTPATDLIISNGILDAQAVNIFQDAKSAYYKSITNFEKRIIMINEYMHSFPPCIVSALKSSLPRGERNNYIYLLARALKKFKTEDEIYEILLNVAKVSFSNSSDSVGEIRAVKATIASALKREGFFISCSAMTMWCDKRQCDVFSNQKTATQSMLVDSTFNINSYGESINLLETSVAGGEHQRYLKTGIDKLDYITKVLQDSLIVIASLSDVGKTSFAISLIKNNQDKKILFLPIEEGNARSVIRMLSANILPEANITLCTAKLGEVTPEAIKGLFYIKNHLFDFMIIDQMVNLTYAVKEERLKYKKIMETLRELAREFKKPIFLLHQLTRETIRETEPRKEFLAEGADIERLAYDVWLLFRRKYNGEIYNLIKVDKNKNYLAPIVLPLYFNFKEKIFEDYKFPLDKDTLKELNIDKKYFYNYSSLVNEDIKINRNDIPF